MCILFNNSILTENIVNIRKEMLGTTEKEREEMAKEILKCAVKILLYDLHRKSYIYLRIESY